jgi:cholesterol oxidase
MGTINTDVCVIGSGFGGSISTLRMTQAGAKVTLLEMGHRWDSVLNPAWTGYPDVRIYEQKLGDMGYWMDWFNIAAGANLLSNSLYAVISGRGLGGGSLVYSGVSLRAPSLVFDEGWPAGVDRTELDPYYTKVEDQLRINQFTWNSVGYKDGLFGWAAKNAGVSVDPHPSVIDKQICGSLGWCNTGCLRGAKQTIDRTCVKPAEEAGAQVITGAMALEIAPESGGKWRVTYTQSSDPRVPNELWDGSPSYVVAEKVIISAGAVNSPTLLMRSAHNLSGGLSEQIGKNLSVNGDSVVIAILPEDLPEEVALPLEVPEKKYIGPMVIGPDDGVTCFQYVFEPPPGFGSDWRKFVLQPVRLLPIAAALTLDPNGLKNPSGNMETFGVGPKHLMEHYGRRMLQIGVMGQDGMDGQVSLTVAGTPTVSFNVSQQTRDVWAAARAGVRQIIETGAGGTVLPTWDSYRPGDMFGIHPLGSCRMSDSVIGGVVRNDGAVWNPNGGVYEGLYVLDCSVLARPIIVNTSLTTAAVTERAISLILGS